MALNSIIPCLSDGVNASLAQLPAEVLKSITELRIRKNLPLVIVFGNRVCFITEQGKLMNHISEFAYTVNEDEFDLIFRRLCNYSVHCEIDNMINGFITVNGGNRVGVCSSAVINGGRITSVKNPTSLNIRIAKEIKNCAKPVLNMLYINKLPSIIVAAPPGGGKTTFLRDFARLLSGGFNNNYRKVCIIDERNEISCCTSSGDFADIGPNTDVVCGFPKAMGIENAVRSLSPEMIVCDEISSLKEIEAMKNGFLSGAAFAVSVHAGSMRQLMNKKLLHDLVDTGEFEYIVFLKKYTDEFEITEVGAQ